MTVHRVYHSSDVQHAYTHTHAYIYIRTQTMTVHRIYHYSDGQQGFALTVDRACTFVMLCFFFPVVGPVLAVDPTARRDLHTIAAHYPS